MTRSTDWTFTATASNGTVTTLNVHTREDANVPGLIYASVGEATPCCGNFDCTSGTVAITRDYGFPRRITRVVVTERFNGGIVVEARTVKAAREAFGSALIGRVMDGIRRRPADGWTCEHGTVHPRG